MVTDDKNLGTGLTCFIIGPIGDRLEPVGTPGKQRFEDATQMWEHVFEPACGRFGLTPIRADKITESGEIPEQIFTLLRDADIVIADVTGGNANVMYELGLRHTRDKITIQIGEHERLPFDVNTIRTVKFRRTEAGLIDARNTLIETIRTALEGNGTPVTATRVWNALESLNAEQVAAASSLSYQSDDPADVGDDEVPGRLELMAAGETSLMSLHETLAAFSEQFSVMTEISNELSPRMTSADSFAARIPIFKQFADRLKEPASIMESTSSEYVRQVEEVDVMMSFIIDEAEAGNSELAGATEFEEFKESVSQLGGSAEQASVAFTETLAVVRDMRKWSSLLRPVSRSLEHSLNAILRGNAVVADWAKRLGGSAGASELDLN